MVSWATVQSLVLFFGPLLVPRVLAWYRSTQNRQQSQIRPLSTRCSYALGILFLSGVVAFISTLPVFHPANIFRLTQSRLHTSGGVLMTRLAALRPITPADERLRRIFDEGGLDARLLYAHYGPGVVLDCPFAQARDVDASQTFFFYALPGMLAPHLLHVLALGIATSGLLSGKEGARWRTIATIVGLLLGAGEAWFMATYDDRTNARSTRLSEVDFVYWKVLVWRGLGIAAVDGLLGWMIWLQSTGRAFLTPPSPAERIMDHSRVLEALLTRARGVGVIRNAVVRDAGQRRKVDDYWIKEGEVMKDVLEEPQVLEAQRNALVKMDSVRVGRDADSFLQHIFGEIETVSRE